MKISQSEHFDWSRVCFVVMYTEGPIVYPLCPILKGGLKFQF